VRPTPGRRASRILLNMSGGPQISPPVRHQDSKPTKPTKAEGVHRNIRLSYRQCAEFHRSVLATKAGNESHSNCSSRRLEAREAHEVPGIDRSVRLHRGYVLVSIHLGHENTKTRNNFSWNACLSRSRDAQEVRGSIARSLLNIRAPLGFVLCVLELRSVIEPRAREAGGDLNETRKTQTDHISTFAFSGLRSNRRPPGYRRPRGRRHHRECLFRGFVFSWPRASSESMMVVVM
jgi:hypothetical protein